MSFAGRVSCVGSAATALRAEGGEPVGMVDAFPGFRGGDTAEPPPWLPLPPPPPGAPAPPPLLPSAPAPAPPPPPPPSSGGAP